MLLYQINKLASLSIPLVTYLSSSLFVSDHSVVLDTAIHTQDSHIENGYQLLHRVGSLHRNVVDVETDFFDFATIHSTVVL